MVNHTIKLAIAASFLDAFSRLPKSIQGKTTSLIDKFKRDPTSPSLNYEPIKQAKDNRLKSVRVDQTYRAILLKPEQDNVYLILWVDHHDRAYDWATRHVCQVNPVSGALQVVDVEEASALETELASRYQQEEIKGRFHQLRDRHLLRLGVPEALLGAVRAVVTDEEVEQLLPKLPTEAADAIFMLAAGYTLEETFNEQHKTQEETVDPDNLLKAIENEDSRQRFRIIEDDAELQEMLAAPLQKWRVFLHPSQRRLVERDWNGPVRVLGGAGTGKTVAAMHRAKWLAENRFTDSYDRILFLTFSRNLATDIKNGLKLICSSETMKRIRVENLDQWMLNFLKSEGMPQEIIYDPRRLDDLWEQAYTVAPDSPSLSLSFYKEEWSQVIKKHQINTVKGYLKVSRTGRGTRLNRLQRSAIWPVFEEFSSLMKERGWKERDDGMRDAYHLIMNKSGEVLPFKSIIVDEAQDLGEPDFTLIKSIVSRQTQGNDLFIVGDPHQRIYGRQVILSRCGIEIRGRSHKLKVNYRTTEETRKWATRVLSNVEVDDLDQGCDDLKEYYSLLTGKEPLIKGFASFEEEIEFITQYLHQLPTDDPDDDRGRFASSCIVLRTNNLCERYQQTLAQKDIPTYLLKPNEPDDLSQSGIRIATMHRVKGLEFDHVILASFNAEYLPPKNMIQQAPDQTKHNQLLDAERCLVHVSATRAKRDVLVTYFGQPSPLLPSLD